MRRDIPLLGVAGAVAADALVFGGKLIGTLVSLSGDMIPILSVMSSIVAPRIAWIPSSAVSTALLAIALIYIGYQTTKLVSTRFTT